MVDKSIVNKLTKSYAMTNIAEYLDEHSAGKLLMTTSIPQSRISSAVIPGQQIDLTKKRINEVIPTRESHILINYGSIQGHVEGNELLFSYSQNPCSKLTISINLFETARIRLDGYDNIDVFIYLNAPENGRVIGNCRTLTIYTAISGYNHLELNVTAPTTVFTRYCNDPIKPSSNKLSQLIMRTTTRRLVINNGAQNLLLYLGATNVQQLDINSHGYVKWSGLRPYVNQSVPQILNIPILQRQNAIQQQRQLVWRQSNNVDISWSNNFPGGQVFDDRRILTIYAGLLSSDPRTILERNERLKKHYDIDLLSNYPLLQTFYTNNFTILQRVKDVTQPINNIVYQLPERIVTNCYIYIKPNIGVPFIIPFSVDDTTLIDIDLMNGAYYSTNYLLSTIGEQAAHVIIRDIQECKNKSDGEIETMYTNKIATNEYVLPESDFVQLMTFASASTPRGKQCPGPQHWASHRLQTVNGRDYIWPSPMCIALQSEPPTLKYMFVKNREQEDLYQPDLFNEEQKTDLFDEEQNIESQNIRSFRNEHTQGVQSNDTGHHRQFGQPLSFNPSHQQYMTHSFYGQVPVGDILNVKGRDVLQSIVNEDRPNTDPRLRNMLGRADATVGVRRNANGNPIDDNGNLIRSDGQYLQILERPIVSNFEQRFDSRQTTPYYQPYTQQNQMNQSLPIQNQQHQMMMPQPIQNQQNQMMMPQPTQHQPNDGFNGVD